MRNYVNINNLFNRDRKVLYIVLSIVAISVLTLTIVYAALSTTLNINGQAEVSAANWDIYLDNVQLNNNSVTSDVPIITNRNTATFSTTLSKPGDFYEFTIDVVNNGSIDAMIDSITKTPELTDDQKKYLNYIVEYQNGEIISTKQLVRKNSFVRLNVRIEFRKDITVSDLPSQSETLNLSFKVNYVQSDETSTSVKDEGVFKLDIISGDLETVGSEVAIGDEHFYIISKDDTSLIMLAKYNITTEAIPKQSSSAPTIEFAFSPYWGSVGSGTYVYNKNSNLYKYIENYRTYLESYGAFINDARLITFSEILSLGCSKVNANCSSAPSWVYTMPYWTGTVDLNNLIISINSKGNFISAAYTNNSTLGIRPVIVLMF